MPRLPALSDRDALPPEARAAFDAIAASRNGRVGGPFAMLMHSHELAHRVAHVGTYLRFECPLPANLRELAIISAARFFECEIEYAGHVRLARESGLSDAAIDVVHHNTDPSSLGADEALIIRFARALLGDHRVDAATFDAVRERFGERGLIDITGLLGYYAMLACTLNACEVEPAADAVRIPGR
jgi:4-carboxymuconolactone decarboxylase